MTETPRTPPLRVGLVGLGRMGAPIAENLLKAGFPLAVHNRTRERCEPLARLGATIAETPAELARDADVVITIVADGAAAEAVYGGPEGLLAGLGAGEVALEMSTIGPEAARGLAQRATERGARLLDVPVSGSVPAARAATLVAMAGGDADAFERAHPVLAAITSVQHHLGGSGAGAAMKLAVNALIGVTNLALSEVLVVLERSGVEPALALDVLEGSAIGSPYVRYKRDAFLHPDAAEVFFTLRLLEKDLALARELGRAAHAPMPATAVAGELLALAVALGHGEQDVVRMADVLRGHGPGPRL
jgi:3-hydroxyisobutyrate dehydrogenase-like beta-hydroxyacid dehydrogenase